MYLDEPIQEHSHKVIKLINLLALNNLILFKLKFRMALMYLKKS